MADSDKTRRLTDLLGIQLPILQAPMAGAQSSRLAIAVAGAGALGALPCAMLSPEKIRQEIAAIRDATPKPFNLNFFCHRPPEPDPHKQAAWLTRLAPYYKELGLDPSQAPTGASRQPFDNAACDLIEELRPAVVSFHFGLPDPKLLQRIKATGAKILSSATTVPEAQWLEAHDCDIVIAQGSEAGGHRGMFLETRVETQVGTFALIPQITASIKIPVIAAGGIANGQTMSAALKLGASAVQIGTAYLLCPEAEISNVHRQALTRPDPVTAITNVFTGRPARGILNRLIQEVGPMSDLAPEFPLASAAISPLRAASEAANSPDFAQMWAGQSAHLAREMPAAELTHTIAEEAERA